MPNKRAGERGTGTPGAGLGNDAATGSSRSYGDITRANLFTTYNNILFAIGLALFALGHFYDALISAGFRLLNTAISIFQEIRAKRRIDRISFISTSSPARGLRWCGRAGRGTSSRPNW